MSGLIFRETASGRFSRCRAGVEVEALIAAASPEARPVFELAASTGLRREELLGLRWEDVDFAACCSR